MCFLKFYSPERSFEEVAERTSMPVYSVQEAKKAGNNYVLSILVSDQDWDAFPAQVVDAVAFLKEHGPAISSLIAERPDATAELDFPVYSRLNGPEDIVNQNDHLPPRLIRLAGQLGLGICMAMYVEDLEDLMEHRRDHPQGAQ